MILEQFLLSVNETNCYIVACGETGEAAVIDPGEWNDQMAALVQEQKLVLKWILLTHGHGDHVGGVAKVKAGYPEIKVGGHALLPETDHVVKEGDVVVIGKIALKAAETPGHTGDSLTYYIGTDAFCGDALFAGSVGGTGSQREFDQLIAAIREKIFSLGDDLIVHPGHGPATTVRIERLYNPFFIL